MRNLYTDWRPVMALTTFSFFRYTFTGYLHYRWTHALLVSKQVTPITKHHLPVSSICAYRVHFYQYCGILSNNSNGWWYYLVCHSFFCHCMTYLYIFNLLWELEGSIETETRSSKGKNAIHTLWPSLFQYDSRRIVLYVENKRILSVKNRKTFGTQSLLKFAP